MKAADPGWACKCVYEGAWTCAGWQVGCQSNDDAACINPSGDIASCQEGGGDCGGY